MAVSSRTGDASFARSAHKSSACNAERSCAVRCLVIIVGDCDFETVVDSTLAASVSCGEAATDFGKNAKLDDGRDPSGRVFGEDSLVDCFKRLDHDGTGYIEKGPELDELAAILAPRFGFPPPELGTIAASTDSKSG